MADQDIDLRLEDVEAYTPGPPAPDVGPGRPRSEESYETHMDVALDDEPAPDRKPVFVDAVVKKEDTRLPIIPAGFHGWENTKRTLKVNVERTAYRVAAHSWRAVLIYLPLSLFWSVVGVFRLLGRSVRWWWHPEMSSLLSEAAGKGDLHSGPHIARQLADARKARGLWLLFGLVLLVVALLVLWFAAPRWAVFAAAAIVIPVLAHFGRPKTMPILRPAVVTPRFRRINSDVVLRAYYAAGLGHPDKPNQQIKFNSQMSRDQKETGSMVLVQLPHGKTYADASIKKASIASGLEVTDQQVFLTKSKVSEGEHELFVADRDPLAIPVGKTDMLNCKPRNIWKPMKIGRDERDRLVTLSLLWNSVLVGAQPRKGKTFFVRLILLYCALDPWVKILGADGKKAPDYDKFRLVAHRWIVGDAPNPRDSNPLENFEDMLDEVLEHIGKVNDVLASLPVEMCPEGKLTEELSRDPRYPDLRVWVLVGEEFQVYFETEDQEYNKRIAHKWGRIMAQGPSAGVSLLDSSQKPGGVGAGDVLRLFNRFRDNHQVRFALRCGNMDVSKAVLGGDSYAEGYDASKLPIGDGTNGTNDYRGVGILYGATDLTPTVRTFLADHADAEKILLAARKLREQYGTLSGLAAGEEVAREVRDVMADARSVFYAGEARLSWPELSKRMAELMPQHYADLTPEAISAQLRTLGVVSKMVSDRTHFESGKGRGFDLESLDAAIARRQVTVG
jgi:S-DNA-T family DNA segregation ATPase FtsK/SpoIIIE